MLVQRTSSSKLVYIAGPYTAPHWSQVEINIERAREAAAWLATHRVPFICPHLNSAHFDDIVPAVEYDYWSRMYLEILKRCDAVLTLEGWQRSHGATLEIACANEHDIPVFHDRRKLLRWHRGEQVQI